MCVSLLSLGPIFATNRYRGYFHEVKSQFTASGWTEYESKSGYSGSRLTLSVARHFGESVVAGFARLDTFDGAVFEGCSLVETRDYLVVGSMFGWIFGESETRVEH